MIALDDVNVGKDTALCRACGTHLAYSDLVRGASYENVDPLAPPPGCSQRTDVEGVVVGASHRSLGMAAGLLFFTLFWNGILSVFMVIAYGSLLSLLGVVPPSWIPPMNGQAMGWGMTVFMLLFLIPFELVGIVMVGALAMTVFGRTEVRLGQSEGVVFSGISRLGRRKRFALADVTNVIERTKRRRDSDGDVHSKTEIVIEAGHEVRFGSGIPDKRRHWLAGTLRALLLERRRR